MSTVDHQPAVGKINRRTFSGEGTHTSERGDRKQSRDGRAMSAGGANFIAPRPSSPTTPLTDVLAATESDSDGEVASEPPVTVGPLVDIARLIVDDLIASGVAKGLREEELRMALDLWVQQMAQNKPARDMNAAADALLAKARVQFDRQGFGSMTPDPGQMLRVENAAQVLVLDTWARSTDFGLVGSSIELKQMPPSETDSMAKDCGGGKRTDCESLRWHKCLNATRQGITLTTGAREHLLPLRVVDGCPGHSTAPGEPEKKTKSGTVAEPVDLKRKISVFAPVTFGACMEKDEVSGARRIRSDVQVMRVSGGAMTTAAKVFFETEGYRFMPVSDELYTKFGLSGSAARSVHGAEKPAPWGAYFVYKSGSPPLLVQCLLQPGSCAAGPNARFWGGATGVGLVFLTAANLERAFAGETPITFEDSLFCSLGLDPGKAWDRLGMLTGEDGTERWVSPCVLGGRIGGRITGEKMSSAWEAWNAGTTLEPAEEAFLKASSSWRLQRAWVSLFLFSYLYGKLD